MEVARWLHEMPKPTLAVIPGAGGRRRAVGGAGLRPAHRRETTPSFTTAFSKIGLSGDFGGSYFLNHLVGAAKAREMYFTGQVISGAEAQRIGLVNRVGACRAAGRRRACLGAPNWRRCPPWPWAT